MGGSGKTLQAALFKPFAQGDSIFLRIQISGVDRVVVIGGVYAVAPRGAVHFTEFLRCIAISMCKSCWRCGNVSLINSLWFAKKKTRRNGRNAFECVEQTVSVSRVS